MVLFQQIKCDTSEEDISQTSVQSIQSWSESCRWTLYQDGFHRLTSPTNVYIYLFLRKQPEAHLSEDLYFS